MEELKLVAGALFLAPYVPLVFMGEEYGELGPFHYFISHTDPELAEKVRRGRREEFAAFGWAEPPPDPQDEATFEASKLDHGLKAKEPHRSLLALYRKLIRLRRTHPALQGLRKEHMEIQTDEARQLMTIRRWFAEEAVFAILNFSPEEAEVPLPEGAWGLVLASNGRRSLVEEGGPIAQRGLGGGWPAEQRAALTPPTTFLVLSREKTQ